MPDWFLDEPPITEEGGFYLNAFHRLGRDRAIGMSVGPIPWSSMMAFADHVGLDDDNRVRFEKIISALDATYLKWVAAESKAQRPDPTDKKYG